MNSEKLNNRICGECVHFDGRASCLHRHRGTWGGCEACFEYTERNKPTNGDRIRQMSDGVLAFMMTRLILNGCPISGAKTFEEMGECLRSNGCARSKDCTNCLNNYLGEEALVATIEELKKEVKDE